MPKICKKEDCNSNVWGNRYCKFHQYLVVKKEKNNNDRGLFVREKEVKNKGVFSAYLLDKWFNERRSEMTGICEECGNPSLRDNDAKYKYSIAHLIPKEGGKSSVSCNEYNFIELCWICHQEYDNSWERAMKMKIWETVKVKVSIFIKQVKEKKKFLEYFK